MNGIVNPFAINPTLNEHGAGFQYNINGPIGANVPSANLSPGSTYISGHIDASFANNGFCSNVAGSSRDHSHGCYPTSALTGMVNPFATTPALNDYGVGPQYNTNGPISAHVPTGSLFPGLEFCDGPTGAQFASNGFCCTVANFNHGHMGSHYHPPKLTGVINHPATTPYDTSNGAGAPLVTSDFGNTTQKSVRPFPLVSNANNYIADTGAAPAPLTLNLNGHQLAPTADTSRYDCLSSGCASTFKRVGERDRHMKKHQSGPRDFDCPAAGCSRKGSNGFTRKDKMKDHWKCKHQ